MESITRKGEIKAITDKALKQYQANGIEACLFTVQHELLESKIKFPLLEYAAENLWEKLTQEDSVGSIPTIRSWDTIGGNVLIGIFLRNMLDRHYQQAIEETVKVTETADIWYICDIIGERVYGSALLNFPDRAIDDYERLVEHKSPWVVRALGAGAHHAIKKGLSVQQAQQVFRVLLGLAKHKHKEVRQGIGWAAKTTAKFHPCIIELHEDKIANGKLVDGWFRRKVEIGLARNKHAQRNRG